MKGVYIIVFVMAATWFILSSKTTPCTDEFIDEIPWWRVEMYELVDGATVNKYDSIAAHEYCSPNGIYFSAEIALGDTIWIATMNTGSNIPGLLKSWSAEHRTPEKAAEYLFELMNKYE